MKSFKQYISEDILGGYDPEVTHDEKPSEKSIKSLDELVKKLGNNYTHDPESQRVDLNDKFHIRYKKFSESDSSGYTKHHLNVNVFSNAPGHENTSLATYRLSHDNYSVVKKPDGKEIKMFSGNPQKKTRDVKSGVFELPHNFLHTIANATGYGIMSGDIQSPGSVHMWRKAVQHGHENDHHVGKFIHTSEEPSRPRKFGQPRVIKLQSLGKITPSTFQDAYTGDVSTDRSGNTSKVIKNKFDLPHGVDTEGMITRDETLLGILPK
jgi:hypothetical protein